MKFNTNTPAGKYDQTVRIGLVVTLLTVFVAQGLPLAHRAQAALSPVGANVSNQGTVFFLNSQGQKQPYTSAGAFLSYGFNSWDGVVQASAEDLVLPTGVFVPPMDGSLINDQGTVYIITSGKRAGFTSSAIFTGLGYQFKNVIAGDTSFLQSLQPIGTTLTQHLPGTLVLDSGTVYLMDTTGKMGIPSLSVFQSWGYSFTKVVPANTYDATIGMSLGVMPTRTAGMLSPLTQQSSDDNTFEGTGATAGSLTIEDVLVSQVTANSAVISWSTTNQADSFMRYGLTTAYGNDTGIIATLATTRQFTISGLNTNTRYHYMVTSKDEAGHLAISPDNTFITTKSDGTPGDGTAPTPQPTITPTPTATPTPTPSTSPTPIPSPTPTFVPTPTPTPTSGGPTITLTQPADGATVSGSITVSANVTSSSAVQVQFIVDGDDTGPIVTNAPFSISLDTLELDDGEHSVAATVIDAQQRASISQEIVIDVENGQAP